VTGEGRVIDIRMRNVDAQCLACGGPMRTSVGYTPLCINCRGKGLRTQEDIPKLGPPMAFLNCTLKQDYSDRLFRVTSVGESNTHAGGGFAQLISLDVVQEFLEVDTVALLRDYAVVVGITGPEAPIMRLGDDT
jgi:hypothetical protein